MELEEKLIQAQDDKDKMEQEMQKLEEKLAMID